jgi:hypothetical protein
MHDIFNLCETGVIIHIWLVGWFMVFNATFNNISVISRQSILLVEETGVIIHVWLVGWFMVFNATFNNISVISRQSILLVEET